MDVKLPTANGSHLHEANLSCLHFRIGNQSFPHHCFVGKNLYRNLILGRDWLMQNWGRMYFDLGALRVAGDVTIAPRPPPNTSTPSKHFNLGR